MNIQKVARMMMRKLIINKFVVSFMMRNVSPAQFVLVKAAPTATPVAIVHNLGEALLHLSNHMNS